MRFGVIGAGVIGGLRARSVRENDATELVAVLDPDTAAAQRAAASSGARLCADLDEFFAIDMDTVIVSTPPHLHEKACVRAFELGRHVICEKPLSNTVEGCRRIVEAAQKADRLLAVGFNLRYYPAIEFVKDSIDAGRIGELDHLRIFGGHEGLPKFRIDWQYKAPESGGGAMMDVGIHMTDVGRYLLGEISEVYGVMSEKVWKVPGSEDNAVAVLKNPDGVCASYHATWTEWKGYQFYVEAYGSHGMVRGEYAPMRNLLITMDEPGGRATRQVVRHPWVQIREKLWSWHTTALLSFAGELRDFLQMAEGNVDVRLADGFDGLRSVEVSEAVRESSASQSHVSLPVLGRMRS